MSPQGSNQRPARERGKVSDHQPPQSAPPLPLIAIVGAPNVGKSTLFNRLLGRRKALVHREPGMTRDVNEERWDLGGRPVALADTGGLHHEEADLGQEIRRQVLGVCTRASLLIFVVDGRRGLTPLDEEVARLLRPTGRPILLAVNKLDTPGMEGLQAEYHRLGFGAPLPISAEHGLGIEDLRDSMEAALASVPPMGPVAQLAKEIRIAIVGRPNVGKSSLLNALLGEDRAIVSATPGTTRDSIDCEISRGARSYRLIDTAGIRRGGRVSEWPEALSAMTAGRSLERADVVLAIMDSTEAPTNQDLHVAGLAQQAGRPLVVLLNKWDLIDGGSHEGERLLEKVRGRLRFAAHAPLLTISARTGLRVESILPLVDRIHEQAQRRLGTGRLNAWLERAVAAHPPPSRQGRSIKLYYAAQTGTNPPRLTVFASTASRLHFSYRRYLENSLRTAFGLDLTPVVIDYRERPRRTRPLGPRARKPRR